MAETDRDRRPDQSIDDLHRVCGVYTIPVVASRILDEVGWHADADLSDQRLLEPAAGNGEFVVQAGKRLIASCRARGVTPTIGRLPFADYRVRAARSRRERGTLSGPRRPSGARRSPCDHIRVRCGLDPKRRFSVDREAPQRTLLTSSAIRPISAGRRYRLA